MIKTHRISVGIRLAVVGALLLASGRAAMAQSVSSFETPEYYAQAGLQQINAAEAYALGYTGSGVTVGVVDSGIAAAHPEFLDRLAGGYDFFTNQFMDPGRNYDGYGHGSHVSGIIAARRDGVGMHGVAFDAQIYAVRMPPTYDIEEAAPPSWNFLAKQKLAIINNSLNVDTCSRDSSPPCNVADYDQAKALTKYPAIIESMHNVAASGALMVFAAGNSSQPNPDILGGAPYLFPELEDSWLVVAAVGPDGKITDYSNRCGVAQAWCLSAPGGGDNEGSQGIYSVNAKGGYVRMSGTSMASPHVAGAAALVKQAYPYFTAHNLQQTILTTATSLGSPEIYGWGMLNVGKAVRGPAQFVDTFDVDTQGYSSTFYNDISGAGQLVKRGAGQLTLAGANTYIGPTLVQGGKLVVDGSLASQVQVAAAGILSGSGRIGGLDNAGRIAPGNTVGALTVDGDYISRPGSVYEVEANENGNDQIRVGGTATLQGGVVEVQLNERFSVGSLYPIVTAAGGIVGQYDEVRTEQGLVFLKPSLSYSQPGTLQLAIARNDVAFASYLATANQTAVGNALDAASSAPPTGLKLLYDEILNSSPDTLGSNMDQLSGELHASTQSALLTTSGLVQRTLGQRMRGNIGAGLEAGAPMAQAGGAIPAGAMPRSSAYPLWASVVGDWSALKGNGDAARVETDTTGLFVGGDGIVGNGWRLGAALGYTDGRINVDDRSSRSKVKSYTGALYGGRSWTTTDGGVNLLAGAAYTGHTIDSRRTVTVGGSQTLAADYDARTVQIFAELGYAMPVGRSSVLEPYAGLAWLNQRSQGFAETGGAAALRSDGSTDRITTVTLGLRGKTSLEIAGAETRLTAGLGWRHAAGDVAPGLRLSFVQAGNLAFTVTGAPVARDAAVLDLGVQVALGRRAALGLSYSAQVGQGVTDNSGSLYLKVRF